MYCFVWIVKVVYIFKNLCNKFIENLFKINILIITKCIDALNSKNCVVKTLFLLKSIV